MIPKLGSDWNWLFVLMPVLGQSKPQTWAYWFYQCLQDGRIATTLVTVRNCMVYWKPESTQNSAFSAHSLLLVDSNLEVEIIATCSDISSLHIKMQFPFPVPGCRWQSVLCPAGCLTHGTASRGMGSCWPSWAWRTVMMGCTAAQQIMELEQLHRAVGLSRWKCVSGNAIPSWCHVSV